MEAGAFREIPEDERVLGTTGIDQKENNFLLHDSLSEREAAMRRIEKQNKWAD